MAQNAVPYRPSPPGLAVYPWLNRPDTKFNKDGVFKTGLRLEGEPAATMRLMVDTAVEAAFDEEVKDLPPKDVKKWGKYYPYEIEEDDKGMPTGAIVFRFKQNAVIKVEGEPKELHVGIFDSRDKPMAAQVYGGSLIRVMYKARSTGKMASSQKIGVSLNFVKVQVIKLATGNSEGGFGAVEDGYVEEEGGFAGQTEAATAPASGDF